LTPPFHKSRSAPASGVHEIGFVYDPTISLFSSFVEEHQSTTLHKECSKEFWECCGLKSIPTCEGFLQYSKDIENKPNKAEASK